MRRSDSDYLKRLIFSDARLFCKNKQVNLKNKPKTGNLTEKQAQHPLAWKLNKTKKSARKLKSAIKFEKKAIRKTEICKKTSKFYLQQAQKQATRKPSKNPQLHKKNKPNFAGKPQGWQCCRATMLCHAVIQIQSSPEQAMISV